MVAGVIASRVFPAEPLNHRSLATARRPMKRSEIGTLTIYHHGRRRVPVIPIDARDAVIMVGSERSRIVRPGIRRRGDAWTPGRSAAVHRRVRTELGRVNRSTSASIFTRARHTTSTNFRAPRPPHVLLESDRTPTRDRCPFNSPPAPHAHDCVRGELAS
jgi:hypothetical protein